MTARRPLVFVSYRHVDEKFVVELVSFIKTAGVDVWFDRYDLHDSGDWAQEAKMAFDASDVMLVCYSKAANRVVRGSVFLEWYWFGDRDPGNRPVPVIVQICHESPPPSEFVDVEPVPVWTDADFPVVMAAILDAARGKCRLRNILANEGDFRVYPSRVRGILIKLFGDKGTAQASRWRDQAFMLEMKGMTVDLLGERSIVWRRSYVGCPTHSKVLNDLMRKHPFALINDDIRRMSAITKFVLDLVNLRKPSYDGLEVIGILEYFTHEGLLSAYIRVAEVLLESLRSLRPAEFGYERVYDCAGKDGPAAERFIIHIQVIPMQPVEQFFLRDRKRRRELAAHCARIECATPDCVESEATSYVIAHIRYCRELFICNGKSLEVRVGIKTHERFEAMLAGESELPAQLQALKGHSLWRI